MTTDRPEALDAAWAFVSYAMVHELMHYWCVSDGHTPEAPNWRRQNWLALSREKFPDDVHKDLRVAFYYGALIGYEFHLAWSAPQTMDRLQADAFFLGASYGEHDRDEDEECDPYVMSDDDDDYDEGFLADDDEDDEVYLPM